MILQDKKVLVTGGGSGYGYGIAKQLKLRGCQVWITGRNAEKLRKAAAELEVNFCVADVSCGSDWDKVLKEMGGIDILINNAGFGGNLSPVTEQSEADIASVIATNLTGVILGSSKAGKIMQEQRSGAIINVSSVCALYAWPGWSVYTAAKAGVSKFSHGLYTELRPFGVKVMCLTPSWGQTDFNRAANISGASENPELSSKCTSPDELGNIVAGLLETPDHLNVVDMTVQPMIQDICPM